MGWCQVQSGMTLPSISSLSCVPHPSLLLFQSFSALQLFSSTSPFLLPLLFLEYHIRPYLSLLSVLFRHSEKAISSFVSQQLGGNCCLSLGAHNTPAGLLQLCYVIQFFSLTHIDHSPSPLRHRV